MRSLNLLRTASALVLAISLVPSLAVAQDSETVTITGTFKMHEVLPTVGTDLAGVQPSAADRWWKLTLHGVTYSYEYRYAIFENVGQDEQYVTGVHATSFTFEFFGPDAAVLNSSVSGQLGGGGLSGGAILEVANHDYWYYSAWETYQYGTWDLKLAPLDAAGISFRTYGYTDLWYHFFQPVLPQPRRLYPEESLIEDFRNGNSGALVSYFDNVDLGSDQDPRSPPQINIFDASVLEGNRGTTALSITVTLDRVSDQAVTVNYQTADGTAAAPKDYAATSGTLTFLPGETSKTIAVTIKGDRQREPDETFTVHLSNAVGATFGRSAGTATILSDD